MKVNDIKSGYAYSGAISGNAHVDKNTAGKGFAQPFGDARRQHMQDKLTGMLEDIKVQGRRLGQNINLDELLRYKRIVMEFLRTAISFMLEFSANETVDRRGRRKKYAIVQMVDKQLAALTDQILEQEKDRLNILQLIGDIEGLLINLMA